MSKALVPLLFLSALCAAPAATIDLASPNGHIRLQVSTDTDRHLVYSVTANGHARLHSARAGVLIDQADLGSAVELGQARTRTISEVFPWRGHKNRATNLCQATEIPIRSATAGLEWTLETRVFNDGVAFRYRVPGTGMRRVQGESTCWQLPKDTTVWFQTDTDDYEGEYHACRADQIPLEEQIDNKTRSTHLGPPATVLYPDGGFGLLTEASLYKYSGLTLRPQGGAKLRAAFEDDPNGWSHEGALLSPWRVIVLSSDLNGLVNSDVIPALGEAPDPQLFPQGMNTSWIRPGKAPCTWMVFGNDGAQWDRQKWFVDLCAATGCEYLLVDAGWRSERWGWLKNGGDLWGRAAELCQYAAERNVGIVLWHSYPEGREDSPGLTTIEAREELFRNCHKAGVKGVKIDFFNSESKTVIETYEDLLRRAAKYQLLVNFHGANKPTGEARTWPNEITREGIREQEYVLWASLPLSHYGALPFTRMAVGHGDFLPGYVQPRFLKNTTVMFQMASVVVFSSPFLCWPDNPEAYLDSPLLHYIRTVPVTWDETRILPGSVIGDTVLVARKKGDECYIAGLNCQTQPRVLDLDLTSLGLTGKKFTVYRDGANRSSCLIEDSLVFPESGKFKLSLQAAGGFVIHAKPAKEFAGW